MIWFFNGRYLPSDEVKISVADLTVLRGFGVFDFLVTYNRRPFMLEDHLSRLFNSAKSLGLVIPYSKKEMAGFVLKTIEKNKGGSLTIRIVVTGGISSNNIFPESRPEVAILVGKRMAYEESCYKKGVKVKTYEYQRYLPGAKHINYLVAAVEKRKAAREGYLEVLYLNNGKVLECTTSNIFLVKKKILYTPKENILHGMTKKLVLKLAGKIMAVVEKNLSVADLKTAEEVFLTASDKEIMPVVGIDNWPVADGRPGEFTKKIMIEFGKWVTNFGQGR